MITTVDGIEGRVSFKRRHGKWAVTIICEPWIASDIANELKETGGFKLAGIIGDGTIMLEQPLPLFDDG